MTRHRGHQPNIPSRQKMSLRDIQTTRTTEEEEGGGGRNLGSGTAPAGVKNLILEDLPPPKSRRARPEPQWTLEKFGSFLGIALAGITIILFFYRMNSNIDDIKTDLKEERDKIEKIDEKSNKQASSTENLANSIQRLEGEVSRTQDFIRDRKK